ncbi:2Fe-2S iron-sulfur cluster-binding protein [Mangrovicoccus algicola]|uniref:2Fe-2S iron-sulfur cluster binding domain-containing protein n=1 Tax=Mangrovicoccus algicola TaxID=2771008 RepID=A0A8J6Z6X6_9RHOB|nr:2Fe-2S iron-sulfur cluster-binding protein [Mangrovicoccus algicola]MBE3637610.1 2Fe-2S iron-sulfur cluster binding domain-containing protein [Mangrovicoccus algicola]
MKLTFIAHDGTETVVEARPGDTVMSTALAHDVGGILGECGGSMMCATCHCHVDPDWTAATGARMDGEDDMLDCAASEVTQTSRLSCQIRLTEAMDGLVIRLPEAQV